MVALAQLTPLAGMPPKRIAVGLPPVAGIRFVPVIVTVVPPATGPRVGLTLVTSGPLPPWEMARGGTGWAVTSETGTVETASTITSITAKGTMRRGRVFIVLPFGRTLVRTGTVALHAPRS